MNVMLKCRLLQKVRDDVDQCGTIKLVNSFVSVKDDRILVKILWLALELLLGN